MSVQHPTILVAGSLAFDRIMNFPGRFREHIIASKIHSINVSFNIDTFTESFGGTAGNIAYSLRLLGAKPVVWAPAGNDFEGYRWWLERHKINTRYIRIIQKERTAAAYLITDQDDNQITAFHPGALRAPNGKVPRVLLSQTDFGIISPGSLADMKTLPGIFKKSHIRYAFDPGQAIPALSPATLKNGVSGAEIFFSNDYELSLVLRAAHMTEHELLRRAKVAVTTLGPKGSVVRSGSARFRIPPAKPKNTSDPTGAGDAYRAGFLYGYLRGLSLDVCGKLGAVASVYTVEAYGTQTHSFTASEFEGRYRKNFKNSISLK
ncbi:MAG: carbohydrate kinase family protein [Patescibacteria group bacterium]|jgi:adenosine kinase